MKCQKCGAVARIPVAPAGAGAAANPAEAFDIMTVTSVDDAPRASVADDTEAEEALPAGTE